MVSPAFFFPSVRHFGAQSRVGALQELGQNVTEREAIARLVVSDLRKQVGRPALHMEVLVPQTACMHHIRREAGPSWVATETSPADSI